MFEKSTTASTPVYQVDVFLRTCCRTGIEHPTDPKPRCVADTRATMIIKCLSSLVNSIKNSKNHVKLWIVDDHSGDEFLALVQAQLEGVNHHIEPLTDTTGFRASAVRQGELCLANGREFVYLVEDDYFHDPHAIDLMVHSLISLQQSVNQMPCAIFPYDCVDRYHKEFPQPCRVFYTQGLHWRTVTKSSNTVMLSHGTFYYTYGIWNKMFANYDPWSLSEDHTINTLWSNMVDFGGKVVLFSPIPSVAMHLEHQEPTVVSQGLIDWRQQWQALKA